MVHRGQSTMGRIGRLLIVTALSVGLLSIGLSVPPTPALADTFATQDLRVTSGSGADQVELDTTLFIPATATQAQPAASIIIAHGYGGTKEEGRGQATKFARDGYVVVIYSARGFGNSTGQISMDAPDYEVADASTLIDLLGQRPEVLQDGAGDPRVGMFGGSYGGGLALLAAAYDHRVDAVNAARTWNSLVNALFPNDAGMPAAETPAAAGVTDTNDGVFKKLWAQFFFQGGSLEAEGGGGRNTGSDGVSKTPGDSCGGLRPEYCTAYQGVLAQNRLTDDMRTLLQRSSPASVIDQIAAPTLLTQGEGDKLFSLQEADANARGIAANGTPVKLVWVTGGHGSARPAPAESAMLDGLVNQWFDFYLRKSGPDPGTSFDYTNGTGQSPNGVVAGSPVSLAAYPGLAGNAAARIDVPVSGQAQQVQYPAGGTPAALTSLPPGFFPESGDRQQDPVDIPDQIATFQTEPLPDGLDVVGSPVLNLNVSSPTGEAVLFAKVYDVDANGGATLVQDLVAPARLTKLPTSVDPAASTPITLPALAYSFGKGHVLRVVVSSTDQGYATAADSTTYQVALAGGTTGMLGVPDVTGAPPPQFSTPPPATPTAEAAPTTPAGGSGNGVAIGIAIAAAAAVVIVVIVVVLLLRRRRAGNGAR